MGCSRSCVSSDRDTTTGPGHSPVCLIGVRDIRDYRIVDRNGRHIVGGSAFNLEERALVPSSFDFYRINHEMITRRKTYTEAAHHLVFLAWLHRVVNSGGRIERDYAVGLGRMDLHIQFAGESFAIELKLAKSDALEKGLGQLSSYLERLGLDHGYLVLFQRGTVADPSQIGRREELSRGDHRISVLYL